MSYQLISPSASFIHAPRNIISDPLRNYSRCQSDTPKYRLPRFSISPLNQLQLFNCLRRDNSTWPASPTKPSTAFDIWLLIAICLFRIFNIGSVFQCSRRSTSISALVTVFFNGISLRLFVSSKTFQLFSQFELRSQTFYFSFYFLFSQSFCNFFAPPSLTTTKREASVKSRRNKSAIINFI